MKHASDAPPQPVDISVVIPAYNEADCIEGTVREVIEVMRRVGRPFEVLAVDDGSTDDTAARLRKLARAEPHLRVFRLIPNSGQSAAMKAGFSHARGRILVTLDADGQNDPADIPRLLEKLEGCDMVCGIRQKRRDTLAKRLGSRLANAVRNLVLHENILDTGCTLKAFWADWSHGLPLEWRGLHRFLPTLAALRGARIEQIAVRHRPRTAGRSKYTNWGRLKETLWDLMTVRWMQKRYRRFIIVEEES